MSQSLQPPSIQTGLRWPYGCCRHCDLRVILGTMGSFNPSSLSQRVEILPSVLAMMNWNQGLVWRCPALSSHVLSPSFCWIRLSPYVRVGWFRRQSCSKPALENNCQINDLNWLKVQQGAQQDAKCCSQVGTCAKRWSRADLNEVSKCPRLFCPSYENSWRTYFLLMETRS